ncbi:STAS domain-containing protein [Algivirga pacifica]|uniref:Anti-sigma factor antagonist n=1 Tax=Algivirga pacifica TaxID=1162670 RepID=A0ABP9D639_9BACT
MSNIKITVEEQGDKQIIRLSGELDASSALELDNVLQESIEGQFTAILIDCSSLDYISSPGIGLFTSRIEEMEQQGTSLVLFGLKDSVSTVFEILGLDQLLKIVSDEYEAKSTS